MISFKQINKNNKNVLNSMIDKALSFNELNEDLYRQYKDLDVFTLLKLRKRLFLIFQDKICIGFIWLEKTDYKLYRIHSLYLDKVKENIDFGDNLHFLQNKDTLYYECRLNPFNKNVLEYQGFIKKNHTIEMKMDLEGYISAEVNIELNLKIFEENKDEALRCQLQNEIFDSIRRIPLSLKDIFNDESQNYYIKGASYFLNLNGEDVGYGQLIEHDYKNSVTLVNFGLKKEYRKKGYGSLFLNLVINEGKKLGFKTIFLRVSPDNNEAVKLYSRIGFTTCSNIVNYEYKVKK